MIKIKRVYDEPSLSDGIRILVDRLWPRGLKKKDAKINEWLREIAPSNELRKWFSHDPTKWEEFRKRYFKELRGKSEMERIFDLARQGPITLLFGSKEERLNNAVALKDYMDAKLNDSKQRRAA